jgi:hypothetical protein
MPIDYAMGLFYSLSYLCFNVLRLITVIKLRDEAFIVESWGMRVANLVLAYLIISMGPIGLTVVWGVSFRNAEEAKNTPLTYAVKGVR